MSSRSGSPSRWAGAPSAGPRSGGGRPAGDCEHPVDDVDRLAAMLRDAVAETLGGAGLTVGETEAMRRMESSLDEYLAARNEKEWRRYDGDRG